MSSTGRGKKGGGASEWYPTPLWATRRMLEAITLPGGKWLELGAGDGSIILAVNEFRQDVEWTAVEMLPERRRDLEAVGANHIHIGPARTWYERVCEAASDIGQAGRRSFEVCVMNPPFSLALDFCQMALAVANHVVLLERSPWIGDEEERFNTFRHIMPDEYRVGRIDFNGHGGDSIPYSWFHWLPGDRRRNVGTLRLLDRTSSGEKKRGTIQARKQLDLF